MSTDPQKNNDPYVNKFLHSPVFVMILNDTIKRANNSFFIAQILSIILFSLGIVLFIIAIILGFKNKDIMSGIFGVFGTISIVSLLLYRPIERIQSGVNELIKSQIACLSFQAQFDSIYGTLATWSQLPLNETDQEEKLKFARSLREAASELINDLNMTGNSKSST